MPTTLIYEVECQLDPDIVADYDAWLPGHVRDVLACPGFLGVTIEIVETPAGERQRRLIRYQLENAGALDHYLENQATRLRTETAERFGGRVHCVRRVLKPREGLAPAAREPQRCLNCGAAITGAHCVRCGQASDVHVLSMREVAGDVTHSLLHLDSRAWRTLRLLVRRPGELTREFVAGRHQSYLPPFRLYLGISILYFTLTALLPDASMVKLDPGDMAKTTVLAPGAARELSEDVRKEMVDAGIDPSDLENLSKGSVACEFDAPPLGSQDLKGPIERACRQIRADGGARLAERFAATAPRLMFLFLPLMAAVALLFYWWPRRLYAEHLVLFLHNHAFTFLLLGAMQSLSALSKLDVPLIKLLGLPIVLLFLYLPYYVFRSMRVVYGQGRALTFFKFFAMATIYFVLLGITMFIGLVYAALS